MADLPAQEALSPATPAEGRARYFQFRQRLQHQLPPVPAGVRVRAGGGACGGGAHWLHRLRSAEAMGCAFFRHQRL